MNFERRKCLMNAFIASFIIYTEQYTEKIYTQKQPPEVFFKKRCS